MKKPIIGISGSVIKEERTPWPGYARSFVEEDYVTSIIAAGGVPLILPVTSDKGVIKQQVEQIDGLLMSGGHDIDPSLYGEEPRRALGETFLARDHFDMELLHQAELKDMVVFGICRGIQIMNVAYGGSLYQDLSYMEDSYIKHEQERNPERATHKIEISANSFLAKTNETSFRVNSFHHLALRNIAEGFRVCAQAEDGVVEAIEHESGRMYAVQFHPELTSEVDRFSSQIFEQFINDVQTNITKKSK